MGLNKRGQVNLERDDSLWARTLVELGGTLSLPLPDVYRMEGDSGQTTLVNVRQRNGPRPTLLLGPPTMRRNSFDLVFDLAPHFSFLRAERFPKVALRTPAILHGVLGCSASLGTPNGRPPLDGEAGQLRAHLARTMPPAALARLAEATRRLNGAGEALDVEKWIGATDLSAARLALALTGELAAAFRVISSEAIPQSTVPIHRRMADLVAFSVSDDYFAAAAGARPDGRLSYPTWWGCRRSAAAASSTGRGRSGRAGSAVARDRGGTSAGSPSWFIVQWMRATAVAVFSRAIRKSAPP